MGHRRQAYEAGHRRTNPRFSMKGRTLFGYDAMILDMENKTVYRPPFAFSIPHITERYRERVLTDPFGTGRTDEEIVQILYFSLLNRFEASPEEFAGKTRVNALVNIYHPEDPAVCFGTFFFGIMRDKQRSNILLVKTLMGEQERLARITEMLPR